MVLYWKADKSSLLATAINDYIVLKQEKTIPKSISFKQFQNTSHVGFVINMYFVINMSKYHLKLTWCSTNLNAYNICYQCCEHEPPAQINQTRSLMIKSVCTELNFAGHFNYISFKYPCIWNNWMNEEQHQFTITWKWLLEVVL
jgi:hypothetical protein